MVIKIMAIKIMGPGDEVEKKRQRVKRHGEGRSRVGVIFKVRVAVEFILNPCGE